MESELIFDARGEQNTGDAALRLVSQSLIHSYENRSAPSRATRRLANLERHSAIRHLVELMHAFPVSFRAGELPLPILRVGKLDFGSETIELEVDSKLEPGATFSLARHWQANATPNNGVEYFSDSSDDNLIAINEMIANLVSGGSLELS